MTDPIYLLTLTAASIGFFHTLAGPDHYLPFIMMARARRWSCSKTAVVTFVCGIGHILSSVLLGFLGIALGIALVKLELVESFRGDIAAWGLTTFGFVYMVWGIHRAIKNRPHSHIHMHEDGSLHDHEHGHSHGHAHVHERKKASITPWILFTIFIFGPCEPLIPILMYPAARESISGLIWVTSVFAITTIGTMLVVVMGSFFGLERIPFGRLERYTHAMAGAALLLCGFAILFLGL